MCAFEFVFVSVFQPAKSKYVHKKLLTERREQRIHWKGFLTFTNCVTSHCVYLLFAYDNRMRWNHIVHVINIFDDIRLEIWNFNWKSFFGSSKYYFLLSSCHCWLYIRALQPHADKVLYNIFTLKSENKTCWAPLIFDFVACILHIWKLKRQWKSKKNAKNRRHTGKSTRYENINIVMLLLLHFKMCEWRYTTVQQQTYERQHSR